MISYHVFEADPVDQALLERVVGHLEDEGLLGYPTETVYGLGASSTSEGVEVLRGLKERKSDKPFLVLLPDAAAAMETGLEWGCHARALAERHWPGPLTLALKDPQGRYPEGVRNARGGVAVRVSSDPFVRALMTVWKRPLLSTSANTTGQPPARTIEEVRRAVTGRLGLDRLWIVDGGSRPSSAPSTIVDCTASPPTLVREGAIPFDGLLEAACGLGD